MASMNAEAVEFEIARLQECCAQYRDDIKILLTDNRKLRAALERVIDPMIPHANGVHIAKAILYATSDRQDSDE